MKKRTKILFGVAILIATVSMNIRHARMNYGIVKDKIAAGVLAEPQDTTDTTNISPTICDPKPGFENPVADKTSENTPTKRTECIVKSEVLYYTTIDNKEVVVATETTNYKTGEVEIITKRGWESSYRNLNCKAGKVEKEMFSSPRIVCSKGIKKGQCCYPVEPITDCKILLKQKTT